MQRRVKSDAQILSMNRARPRVEALHPDASNWLFTPSIFLRYRRSPLTLAIGTSNLGQQVNYHSHRAAWVQAVDSVQNYVTQAGYSQRLSIVGADDMELDYNTSRASFPWVQGFADANSNQRLLMDYGDSAACPQSGTTTTPGACNNGWTQQTVWNAAYYFTFEFPTPEIYTPDSAGQSHLNFGQFSPMFLRNRSPFTVIPLPDPPPPAPRSGDVGCRGSLGGSGRCDSSVDDSPERRIYGETDLDAIALPDSAQARQWQQISLWRRLTQSNQAIRFVSSFTQLGSCQQGHYCAPGTDNSPDTGFSQLWDAIYSDSRTAIGFSWSTDIRYER